jgi:hypothetical protein
MEHPQDRSSSTPTPTAQPTPPGAEIGDGLSRGATAENSIGAAAITLAVFAAVVFLRLRKNKHRLPRDGCPSEQLAYLAHVPQLLGQAAIQSQMPPREVADCRVQVGLRLMTVHRHVAGDRMTNSRYFAVLSLAFSNHISVNSFNVTLS